MLARGFFLAPPTAPAVATDDPALAALYATRRRLEEAVAALRARKAAMDSTAYQEELEALLLRLARTNREIRTLEEGRREP
ncbi:MAG: hypothetical protein GWN85_42275 [Gemmatimonadetes bacterium]|nr:hypothetical protein [Gemmatimonadota bacterium]